MEFFRPIRSPRFSRETEQQHTVGGPALDLKSVMFDTSLSYSSHHEKMEAAKKRGPAAITAQNSGRRKQVK